MGDGLVAPPLGPHAAVPWATDGILASQLGPRSRPAASTRALVAGVLRQVFSDAVSPDRTVASPRRGAVVQADARRWSPATTRPRSRSGGRANRSDWIPSACDRRWRRVRRRDQMAEVAVPRELFGPILDRITRLRPPDPAHVDARRARWRGIGGRGAPGMR